MKRFLIFFILMVTVMTFSLTRTKKYVMTQNAIKNYRQSLVYEGYNKDEIEALVKIKSTPREKEGKPFKEALKTSLIVSTITLGFFYIVFYLRGARYNELYGSHLGSNIDDKYRRRSFLGFSFFHNLFK